MIKLEHLEPSDVDNTVEAVEEEESEVELSFEAARAELESQEEDESKFEKHGHKFVTNALNHELHCLNGGHVTESSLEKYQIEAVLAVKRHFSGRQQLFNGNKMAMIIAPPGSGKSGMVTLIPYVLQSRKVLILTPSKIISEQLAADFGYRADGDILKAKPFFLKSNMYPGLRQLKKLLEPVHLAITQKEIDNMTASNLVIVNAQKFGGRSSSSLSTTADRTPEQRARVARQLQEFDTIIVDEAHHYPAKTWVNIVEVFAGKMVIFLTATPFRGDSHMSKMLHIETVYKIDSYSLEGTTIRRTEFIERTAVAKALGDPDFLEQLNEDIDELLNKHDAQENRAPPHQAMILVRTKAEAEEVAKGLVSATPIMSDKDGKDNLEQFTAGRKRIAVVCGMLREGYDNPKVSLVVILRKCKSRVLFDQFCGRCMRVIRDLTGVKVDQTVGTVLSYKHFNQSGMWAKRLEQSEEDPEEDQEDGGKGEENIVANVI